MSLAGFYGGSHKGSVFGYSAQYGGDFHYGQDIKGHPVGTPIPALAAGTVVRAGWQSAHGYWLAVDTGDGWFDTYSHMVSIWHDVGAWVGQGATVGPLGNTGLSTGPHLHLQRTRNPFPWSHGTEVDPWPRIAQIITGTASGGSTPFIVPASEESEMIHVCVAKNRSWMLINNTTKQYWQTGDQNVANMWARLFGDARIVLAEDVPTLLLVTGAKAA